MGLLIWSILSLLWSQDPGNSRLALIQFGALMALALIASQLPAPLLQRYLIPAALLAATLVALIGICQYFGWNPLPIRQSSPPASTFLNKNYAANYLDLLVPVALLTLLAQPRPTDWRALLAGVAFALGLGFLIISQTRGSWLGLFVAGIALIVIYLSDSQIKALLLQAARRHRYTLLLALVFAIGLSVTESQVHPDREDLAALMSMTPDRSTGIRLDMYLNASVGIFENPLLGVGYGAFASGFMPYVAAINPVEMVDQNVFMTYLHSDPLQMFFELGILGGVLSILIYLVFLVLGWRIIHLTASPSIRLTAIGLLLAMLASGAHAWVDFPLRLPTSAFFFWIWGGLIVALYLAQIPHRRLAVFAPLAVITGIVALGYTLYSAQVYSAYWKTNQDIYTAQLAALDQDCDKTLEATDRAMDDFGQDHFTRFWYVKVYTYCDAPAEKKRAAIERVLRLDSNIPLAYLTRAKLSLAEGDLLSASEDFHQYLTLLPHQPQGYTGMGIIAIRLNKLEQAQYWIQEALKRAPDDAELQRLDRELSQALEG
ncbi:O-antigen ligase family protein [Thiohalophilus sp.]|uniref:O-antigen ligase family protein n=1 Tax=Thiohalophilus sp. TaxID=3028392 RepID=UPI0039750F80